MADIELVIRISYEDYKKISNSNPSYAEDFNLYYAIKNGILLPKGHGRLIDADALNRKDVNCANVPMNFIDIAPTIIEAKSEEEETENKSENINDLKEYENQTQSNCCGDCGQCERTLSCLFPDRLESFNRHNKRGKEE